MGRVIEYLNDAINAIYDENAISTSVFCRCLDIDYNLSAEIMDKLESLGVIGEFRGMKPREILVTKEKALKLII